MRARCFVPGLLLALLLPGTGIAGESVEALIAALRGAGTDHDLAVRALAAKGEWVVPVIVKGLDDRDHDVRRGCARVLGILGPSASDALPALRRRLADRQETERPAILSALARIAPDEPLLVERLVAWAGAGSWEAAAALARLRGGQPAALLAALANSRGDAWRAPVTELLAMLDMLPPEKETLRMLLGSGNVAVREWAALLLARVDPSADGLLPEIRAALRHERGCMERGAAFGAAAAVGPRALPLLEDMLSAAADRFPRGYFDALALGLPADQEIEILLTLLSRKTGRADADRERAASLLAARGEAARAAIPLLTAALSEEWTQQVHICATLRLNDRWGHPFAAEALGKFGPLAAEAVPALEEAFRKAGTFFEDFPIAIARALGSIGPPARDSLARLSDDQEDQTFRLEVLMARARIDPGQPARVRDIAAAIRSGHTFILIMSRPYFGLPRVGPGDEWLLPALLVGLDAPDPGMRIACARLHREITGSHGPMEPAVLALLGDEDDEVRLSAALELAREGTHRAPALDHLRRLLRGYVAGDIFHVPVILETLGGLGPLAAAAAPEVRDAIAGPWEVYREPAIRCLRAMGPGAEPAREALERLVEDEDRGVRSAARDALRALGPRR